MSYTYYSYLGLIPDPTPASLTDVYERLKKAYENDKRDVEVELGRTRVVLVIDEWTMRIYLSDAVHIQSESRELADEFAKGHPKQENIAACKRRFETSADSDGNMDFFNDSLTVLEIMESFGEVYIFDSNTPEFTNL